MEPLPIIAIASGVTALSAVVVRTPAFKRWLRKVKRRKGGVYLWRVDHHQNRARRVNGYVGETVSFVLRSKQHLGISMNQVTLTRNIGQPWSDLHPVMYRVISLPWWLCWKWVLRPLETLVMLVTWPVYNHAKNGWNPRRIPLHAAKVQRARRDQGLGLRPVIEAHVLRRLFIALMVTVICMAAYVYAIYS